MLYVPVNFIALGMGAVYEQTTGDDNVGYITVRDAEIYKDWHNDGIRNARRNTAPSMVVQAANEGFCILFDKEAVCADGSAAVTITAGGREYTAKADKGNIWGSHKVAEFKYSDFKAADGTGFEPDGAADYTVKIGQGAFADYYNGGCKNGETVITVDLAAQTSEKAAAQETARAQSAEIAINGGNGAGENAYVPDSGEALTVSEALGAVYRLLSMKEINAITSDQINFDGEGPADVSSDSVATPEPAGRENENTDAPADAAGQPGGLVWVWIVIAIAAACVAVFAALKLRGKNKDGNKK